MPENTNNRGIILVQLPENCPICKKKMEKGTLRTTGKGTDIEWGPPDMGFWKRGEVIGRAFIKVDLSASRCTQCKVIMFPYGEVEKKEE